MPTAAGHLRLTDFGLAKRQQAGPGHARGGASTFCGTLDYMAPEIVRNQRYDESVDWWSFGCLLFEMTVGYGARWCRCRCQQRPLTPSASCRGAQPSILDARLWMGGVGHDIPL